ncbi:MAG: restriction endonuclease subunit S [Candidatus Thiodiazotropha taylori]|nr:restriction endonuclease subunit S [Candidatus Thiodiazotropha taylori]
MKVGVKLGEIATIYSGGTPSRGEPSYWGGDIPWVKTTQIQNGVITEQDIEEWITDEGLRRSAAKMVPKGSVLMAMIGQGKTRGQVAILNIDATTNQNAAAILALDGNDPGYIYQQLLFRYKQIRNISNSSGQQNLNLDLIRSITFPKIDNAQQPLIANLLTAWDTAIVKTEQLISAKEKQFDWLKSTLLLRNPNAKHWKTYPLGQFIEEKKEKSTFPDLYPCLTSSRRGMFLQNEYFSRQVASKDNTGYKIMDRGDFTFRSMSDDGIFVFNQQNIVDKGLISPAYGVFASKCNMDPDYLYYFLNSSSFRRSLAREVQGGTRTALKLNALKKLDVDVPELQEQKAIANKLNVAKQEINLLVELAEQYRKQKRGLMQKLLTGEWRVNTDKEVA